MDQPVGLIDYLRQTALRQDGGTLTDGQLLEAYASTRDHGAFAALVRRHGPMVLGVCRRVLGNVHEAEDAFQATFLVLVRKAGSIKPREMVGNWLHGVAYHVAQRARTANLRRLARERQRLPMAAPIDRPDQDWQSLQDLLDQELQRLPENYRIPIVLCELEGKSRKEASRHLGWQEGTVASRLARGRAMLARRMSRHGLTLSGAALAAALAHKPAAAAVPATLITTTLKAAATYAAGQAASGAISVPAAALAEGVIKIMFLNKLKNQSLLGLVLVALLGGTSWLGLALATGAGSEVGGGGKALTGIQRGQAGGAKQTDAEKLIGKWAVSKARSGGVNGPEELAGAMNFSFAKDGSLTLSIGDQKAVSGTYKLLGAGEIDMNMEGKGMVKGIYKIEGNDQLTLCAPNDPNAARPRDFAAEAGTSTMLFTMKRVDPNKKLSADENARMQESAARMREAAARTQAINHLKQVGLAFHIYNDVYKQFPLHAIYSKDGKTALLSWRVAILPYIEEQLLYNQFKLDEPWDSEHNKKLIPKMPKLYSIPGAKDLESGQTHFQIFTGPNTAFDGNKKITIADITDGTSNTIMVAEAKEPVIWTRPADLVLPREKEKMPALGGHFKGLFLVGLFDGSVMQMRSDVPVDSLRALVTPAGGEVVPDVGKLIKKD